VKQFEIWWADLREPVGPRPVLLLTRSPATAYLSRLMVCEVTTTVRDIPQEVALGRREGLARPCVANLDNVHVVPKVRLGVLPARREREVKRALSHALAGPELTAL
jgi:mRNA interferase MazF